MHFCGENFISTAWCRGLLVIFILCCWLWSHRILLSRKFKCAQISTVCEFFFILTNSLPVFWWLQCMLSESVISKVNFHLGRYLLQRTYCRETVVRRLQVDSPRLRHTSTLCRYIVRLCSRIDDSDTLSQQTQNAIQCSHQRCKTDTHSAVTDHSEWPSRTLQQANFSIVHILV